MYNISDNMVMSFRNHYFTNSFSMASFYNEHSAYPTLVRHMYAY